MVAVMAFYAFAAEAPTPRTQFETEPAKIAETAAAVPSVVEQAVVNVLIRFPEAHRAVVEEIRRLREERKQSP